MWINNRAAPKTGRAVNYAHNLLILNYTLDSNDPVLAHQVEVVEKLALEFKSVTVLTGRLNWVPTAPNIHVYSSDWKPGHNLQNVIRFYRVFLKLIRSYKFDSVFSHMTTVQSSLVAPILRFRKINHSLWYAHSKYSVTLLWAHFWVNKVLTSTEESCPIKSKKIRYLGQMVDDYNFPQSDRPPTKRISLVHVGRLDPSKNIHLIIDAVFQARKIVPELTITFIGNSSDIDNSRYMEQIIAKWEHSINDGWLTFKPAVPRDQVGTLLSTFDIFIHAYEGSLDKSLVEATMVGIPVITRNLEYQRIFGVWEAQFQNLESELLKICRMNEDEISNIILRRRKLAVAEHSLNEWVKKFLKFAL